MMKRLFALAASLVLTLAGPALAAPPQPAYVSGAPSSGMAKFTAKQTVGAATAGTDYAPATSGSAILYGNGAGGFSGVTIGSGCTFTTGTLSCAGTGGSGTVTTSGSPASGNLTKFSGASAVTNGDLAGVVTTSGTLTTSFASIAANSVLANWTGSSAAPTANAYPSCADTGGNHLNYVGGTGITCGTSGSGGTASIAINTQSGTTYTVVSGDQGKLVRFTNTGGVTVTMPSAATVGAGWIAYLQCYAASSCTINASSSIAGLSSYFLYNGGTVTAISDGSTFQVMPQISLYGGSTLQGYSLNRPDSSSVGGNSRGQNAVDLQTTRSSASQVASGGQSFVAGSGNTASQTYASAFGNGNTASGSGAFVAGSANTVSGNNAASFGNNNSVSGSSATALGSSLTANGANCVAIGANGTCNGNSGEFVHASSNSGIRAAAFRQDIFSVSTSGATAARLTTDNGGAGASNVASMPASSFFAYQVECVVTDENFAHLGQQVFTIGESLAWTDSSDNVTLASGNPSVVAGASGGTAFTLQANPTITADNTNHGFNISFTPPTSNTDQFVASCRLFGMYTK